MINLTGLSCGFTEFWVFSPILGRLSPSLTFKSKGWLQKEGKLRIGLGKRSDYMQKWKQA
ncbi:Hypothetical protein Minf_1503 [Methylacidiphilum infernorum V4]|uniref:Uncharacterized protein n=1 Tax=Methylacidiphilum infernorum (isolate V4) TaxID=481448 RepID=B3DW54_METI4|nr:Hypothetical protein Minf_1503 [Methylacidiphilum infernorum V4]